MGLFTKLTLLILTLASAYLLYLLFAPAEIPKISDEYWGPASLSSKPEDTSIHPFKISIDDKVLKDLKSRLQLETASSRLSPPLEGIGFEYGFNTKFLPKILTHWTTKYDWRQREALLNKYPQFKTKIGGIDIHFQRIKSNKNYKKTLPLLLLHGWPGTFVEFQKIIPMLTDPSGSEYNYELIIPSLPGYGFSEAAARPGMDTVAMSNIFLRLMKRLGFEKFNIMGGDWGALIVADMAALYPENVLGSHSTMCSSPHPLGFMRLFLASLFPSWLGDAEINDKVFPLSRMFSFLIRETGYLHLQATKPDTVGVALSQSPSGLAAYILEKFSTWTDRSKIGQEDGGLLDKFTMDELLDNVMVYWVTNSITSSMRLYAETLGPKKYRTETIPITGPTACQVLPEELALTLEFTLKEKYFDLRQYTISKKGGHFGAFEVPEIVAEDVLKFFNSLQKTPPKKSE